MADKPQIVAFEAGALRKLENGSDAREAVLALPLNRLLVKMVRVPAESKDDPVAFVTPILQSMSPYTDEQLTASCEAVRETEGGGLIVIAAALPEGASEDLGEQLDADKLSVTRIDALVIGALRGLWNSLGANDGARRLVILNSADCLSAVVLDGDGPSAIRSISTTGDIKLEIFRLLLEAEDFGGSHPLKEIVVASAANAPEVAFENLEAFAPLRRTEIGEDVALVGVAERTEDPSALNALPASWREVLEETRFKAKLVKNLAVAGGIWALLMAVIFGVPAGYAYMTDRQKDLCKEHSRQYEDVKSTQDKVNLVRKYSDHARGSLEIMKCVSDRLPAGITLTSWNFKREDGVKVSGEAEDANSVYSFKENMEGILVDDGDGNEVRLFQSVNLNGPTASKSGQKFELECLYVKEETE